jgi:EmrB/QacA subfamily drug resistance transporter
LSAPPDRLLLAGAIIGQFLSGFGARIFIVSMPTIAGDLRADIIGISWALIAYQLANISLSVVFGRLGDLHGRYGIYGLGFVVMAVSSFMCGVASTVPWLVVFRLAQGIGAAMVASAARVLAMDAMPEGAEGRANGYMTAAFHTGVLLGPPLGGFVIDAAGWRWSFFLLVPIGVIGAILTAVRARGRRPAAAPRAGAIDYLGAFLLVVLTVNLTVVLDRRSAEALGPGPTGALVVAFVVILAGFLAHERRASDPIVNLALFRIRMFSFSVLSLLIIATVYAIMSFLLPFYIQEVLDLSASFMGLMFLAAPVFTLAFAVVSGRVTDRIGPQIPAAAGVVMTMGAFVVGLLLRPDSHWFLPTVLLGLAGLGTGFFNTPNQTAIIGSVPKAYRGFATGMVQMMFAVGSLLGIALATVLLTAMFRYKAGLPEAPPSTADPVPFVFALNGTFLVCLGLGAVALAASLMRGRTRIEPGNVG